MNHYYIEFMIKERRRDERKECERRRRLNLAGHSHPGPMQKAGNIFVGMMRRIREQIKSRNGNRQLDARLSVANNVVQSNGEGR